MLVSRYEKRIPIFLALIVLMGLMGTLLILNYRAQLQQQKRIRQWTQTEFNASAERLNLALQRFMDETAQIANSPEVTAFFKNRALGMSMKYGLSTSLNIIRNLFANQAGEHTSSPQRHYEAIFLLDEGFQPLTTWPEQKAIFLPQALRVAQTKPCLLSYEAKLYLLSPIEQDESAVGYIVTIIPYTTLHEFLQPRGKSSQSPYLVCHKNTLVFPLLAPDQKRILCELFQHSTSENEPATISHPGDLTQALQRPFSGNVFLFRSSIPRFALDLYRIEDAASLYDPHLPLMLLVVMLLFSTSLILFSLRLVRSSSRNQGLSENLMELKIREAALSDKNRELELIISGAELGTWLWDVPSGAITINEQWAHMLGYELHEINHQFDTWIKMVHPQDWKRVKSRLDAHLAGSTAIYSADLRLQHKLGHWIWVRDIGQVFSRDEAGHPILVRGIHIDITELKTALNRAEEARREADSVICNFLDSLLVVDRQLRISRVNKETCQLLDCPEQQLIGLPISELFVESAEIVNSSFDFPSRQETEHLEELRNIELTFKGCDGHSVLPVSVNLARLTNEQGETIGVIAGARDVSKLNQALRRTEEQKRFIENILNIVPGGLLVLDDTFSLQQQNHTFDQLLENWHWQYGFRNPDLRQEILLTLARSLQHNSIGEFSLSGESGELTIEYYASLATAQDERINRVIFLHDVTRRRQAEAVRKLHSTVLKQTSEGVLITDTDGSILFSNLAAQKMSGYGSEELQGQRTSLFKSGVQNQTFYNNLWTTIQAGNIWTGSLTNRAKDGTLFEVETSISPVRDDKNTHISHYVSLWRDVSQERALQQQLLQAQKLEAVGQLAAGVAHEINTPIQYIQNNLTFLQNAFGDMDKLLVELQRCTDTPEVRQAVLSCSEIKEMMAACDLEFLREEIPLGIREALDGVDHVSQIVGAMKAFSHPGNVDRVDTDLNKLIQNAALVTRNEWKYNAEMETDLDPGLPLFSCDPGAWSQVLLNLIVNSADAIKEQKAVTLGKIRITTRSFDGQLELSVSDTGGGIPEEVRSRIFEPFFTTKSIGKGTGQGLAIVYDIVVKKHQGTIRCDSRVGEGTTMILRVPLTSLSEENQP
ncbi:MAG: PAS domain S-box protein [Desulfuromonadaceae bacterium]|nr:PAS domain S-box protein [Desulfuromonadaceae bacterium]